ncbi:unnamed protein product [Mytilus edulis]|uniref:Uncharacterized protein n=1 Tax=Mytilus edulis TaxID=6550 RepID=A0A8S3QYH0_MYTED|nr:unnamed protein product [Mytilus edulis]
MSQTERNKYENFNFGSPISEENQQVLPSVGSASAVDSDARSSRSTLPGVITLPPLPSLNLETNAETSVESITNITIQSNAVTTMDSPQHHHAADHNILVKLFIYNLIFIIFIIFIQSTINICFHETTGNSGPHSSPHQPSTSVTMETTGSSVPHSASNQSSTSAAPITMETTGIAMGTTGSSGSNSSPNQPSTSSAASVAMETAGNGGPNLEQLQHCLQYYLLYQPPMLCRLFRDIQIHLEISGHQNDGG